GWLDRANPTGVIVPFSEATGIEEPRQLQKHIAGLAVRMNEPGLFIVEAPMGEGKTEAAWYVADCWDRRGGQGTYVALPTMATSNQMFDRVGKFLESGAGKKNLMLQHGKAALNDRFEKLRHLAELYDETAKPSAVVAEGWFAANKKHGLLAPYGVGTIDQVLLGVLQTKHVFVRLFGLAGKCVILDEVHAYDAYMTTLMKRLLEWLAALRCPVVLLSATLPAAKRHELLKAYTGVEPEVPEEKPYPRVTTAVVIDNQAEVEVVHVPASGTKEIHLDWVEDGRLVGKLKGALTNGGCAAVIRNTVGLAQETYERLRDGLKDAGIRVELFHARFPFGRRQQIENAVLARYGKSGGPAERDKCVLVATQVVEQSLDLDFDVMVSDVAPVDLVLQRAGRLHRHDRGDRPGAVRKPRLLLIEPELDENGVPQFGDSEFVYARFVLLKSFIALKGSGAVELPGDLERLIEQIYGNEPLDILQHCADALAVSEQQMREEQRGQRRMAKGVMIYSPEADDLFTQQITPLAEDDPEAHRKVQAATRDTEPTVQLVLVYHRNGRDYLDPEGLDPFDPNDTPDVPRLRRLLDNEVTISQRGCVAHYAAQPVPTGWQKCGMLRYHRIVRFDAGGQSLPGEFPMANDRERGVVFI
ncbi:MAG TPA: CRISPR-associated helicase Cas3', partial [Gemmataceae bacterium]|nr:CRISPR-associated helicase Cas3' [Gemmataceae bacterium]